MPSYSRSDLLQPSLSGPGALAAAPYTLQAAFFSAFFGGPFAAAMVLAFNAKRLGRLPRDAAWALAMAVLYAGWLYLLYATPAGQPWREQASAWLGPRAMPILDRLLALIGFLVGAWRHRAEQRSADLFGLKRPNGWLGGIAMIVAGNAASWAFERIVLH